MKLAYVTSWPRSRRRGRKLEFTKGVIRHWKKAVKKALRAESRELERSPA